jgi:DNA-binding transcriptional LysR family regulator
MELYQVRSFVAVAEQGNVTRAADKLNVSQPAVSAQIKALEQELGVSLFERKASGMELTAAGKRLLATAEQLLAAAHALRNEARAINGAVAGVVRMGTLSDPQVIRVGELITAAVERYPLLEIQFHHEVTGGAYEKVRDGELDASFYYGDLSHPAVAEVALRDLVYRVVAPAAWRAQLERADWPQLASQPWILTPPISTHHRLASALFSEHGIEPAKVVEADDEFVVGSLVVAGVGIGLMREDLALEKAAAGEVLLWSEVRLTTPLKFIYLRERAQDRVIQALVCTIEDVWGLRGAGRRPRSRALRRGTSATPCAAA